jgi:hypothetical protein
MTHALVVKDGLEKVRERGSTHAAACALAPSTTTHLQNRAAAACAAAAAERWLVGCSHLCDVHLFSTSKQAALCLLLSGSGVGEWVSGLDFDWAKSRIKTSTLSAILVRIQFIQVIERFPERNVYF